MINKIIKKSVCLLLVSTQAVWAMPMPSLDRVVLNEAASFFQIEIPEDLATVEEVYEAPASQNPKVILHIQNVHGNYRAQVQVKKMLDYFYKNYGFKIIFCEGAAEKLDSKYLELFPEKNDNLALADELAKKGQLTGPELYLMDAPKDVQAIGIEQTELYRGNYEAFKEVYKSKKGTDSFLKRLDSRLELLSSRFLTRDMRRILSEWQKFHEGRREFMPFVKHLAEESQKYLNLDLNSLFAQVEWPQTARLLVLQSMEADLKQDEAIAERDKLLVFLKEHKASETLITGLQKMEEKTISLQRLAKGKEDDPFQPRKLLERLAEEGAPLGFQFHQYPNFSLFAGYTILQSELDSKALFQEIEKLFDRILESLTVTEKEKNLLELYKDLELLKKLVALELTRPDWDQATYRKNWIKPQSLVDRLDKMSASGFVTESLLVTKQIPIVFDAAFSFYDFARQREFAFYETIEHELTVQHADRAILVTGGFHTDGLADIFRSKQINYGILTPRMGGDFDKTNYIRTLMETHPTVFDISHMEIAATQARSEVRFQMGLTPGFVEKGVLATYIELLELKAAKSLKAGDVAALSKLILFTHGAWEKLFGRQGVGFQPVSNNQYEFIAYDPARSELQTLRDGDGYPITWTLNPRFNERGERAIIRDRDESKPAEKPVPIGKREGPSRRAVTTTLGGLAVTAGAIGHQFTAPNIVPELPNLANVFNGNSAEEYDFTDAQGATPRDFSSPETVDSMLENGAFVLAIEALSGGFTRGTTSVAALLEYRKQKGAGAQADIIASIAREMGADGRIPMADSAALAYIFEPSEAPGVAAVRMTTDFTQEDYSDIAQLVQFLLAANSKQILALLMAEEVTDSQVDTYRTTIFRDAFETAQQFRFLLKPQKGLSASEISQEILMRGIKYLGLRGNMSVLAPKYFAGADEQGYADVPERFRPFYGPLITGFPDSVENASPETRRGLLKLSIALATKLSRLGGAPIDQRVADYLERVDQFESTYSLNRNALSLALSMTLLLVEAKQAFGRSA